MLKTHSPHHRLTSWGKLASQPELSKLWGGAEECSDAKDLAVESINVAVGGRAELRGVLDKGIEHWLEIERRSADDLEHLARGRLLFWGLAEHCVSLGKRLVLLVQFREQLHIFDGDNSLVGAGFEQADLLVSEQLNVLTIDH